jgi:hypothetical protein
MKTTLTFEDRERLKAIADHLFNKDMFEHAIALEEIIENAD